MLSRFSTEGTSSNHSHNHSNSTPRIEQDTFTDDENEGLNCTSSTSMVRFKSHAMPVVASTSGNGSTNGSTSGGGAASKSKKSTTKKKRGEYDAAPTPQRYDPSTMSRIGIDIRSDADLDDVIDPPYPPYSDHDDSAFAPLGGGIHDFDLDGLYQAQRRRARYRPSASCRRCLCMTLLFSTAMALLIGLTHLFVGKKVAWSQTKTPHGTTLPPAPNNLKQICTFGNIHQPGGYTRCEALCVEAECCFLPEGHWFSCKKDFSARCATYEVACGVLDGYGVDEDTNSNNGSSSSSTLTNTQTPIVVQIPPAKANLDEICSPSSLATVNGFQDCSGSCELARCCSQPIEVCKVSNPQTCDEYSPCSVLLDGNGGSGASAAGTVTSQITPASHPEAIGSQAQKKCHTASLMDEKGVKDCREFCDPALCCFAPDGQELDVHMMGNGGGGGDGGGGGGDYNIIIGCANADSSGWCSQYDACSAIFTVDNEGYGTDEVATEAVSAACSDLSSDAGKDQCKQMCTPADCCFVDLDHCTRTGSEEINCDHYAPCYEYYDLQSGETAQQVLVPRPPPNLENTCAGSKFRTPEGRQMCADACSVAKCCVTDIDVCKVVNPQMCGAFEVHCAEVWNMPHQEVTVRDPPKDLEDKCGGATMNDDRWGQCDDACRPARCCDEDIAVCKVLNPHVCEAYEVHCAVVWGDSYHEVTIPEAPVDIDRKCAGVSISEARRNSCNDACRPAECCDEDISACKVLNPDACEAYEVNCPEVWGDSYQQVTIPTAPAELATVCRAGYSTAEDPNRNQCADLCYMAKCCYEDIEACKVLNPSACDPYEDPCANFWGESVEIPQPPLDLPTMCAKETLQQADGFAKCEKTCDDAACCNKPMWTCRVTNPEVCSNWAPCSQLYEPFDMTALKSGEVEVPPAPSGLATLCGPYSLSNVRGFNDCEDKCDKARCCLEGPDGCHIKNPDVCPAYIEPCTALYDFKFGGKVEKTTGSVDGTPTTDSVSLMDLAIQVAEACDTDSLNEIQGRQHCQHLCNDRLCCFEQDERYNCVKDKKEECVAFAACEELMKAPPLGQPAPPVPTARPPTNPPPTVAQLGVDNEKALEQLCNKDAISTIDGMNKCHDACAPVLCCWSQNPEVNCYDEHWRECNVSQPCTSLAKPDNAPDPDSILKQQVEDACSPGMIDNPEGLIQCHQICAHQLCCFVQSGMKSSCADDEATCADYQACHVLANELPGEAPAAEAVDDACADDMISSQEGRDKCVSICNQRSCCFNDGPGSCYVTDKHWCDEYTLCRNVKNDIATAPTTTPVGDDDNEGDGEGVSDEIDEICAESKLKSKTGLAICHEVCDPHFCCFDSKDNTNCYSDDPDLCDQFEGCLKLYEYEGIEYTTQLEMEIALICSMSKLRSSTGKTMCQQICKPHASCFTGNSNSIECKAYAACKNLDEYSSGSSLPAATSPSGQISTAVCRSISNLPENEATDICCNGGSGIGTVDKDNCERVCRNTECCFKQCPGQASETMVEYCETYAACKVLYSY